MTSPFRPTNPFAEEPESQAVPAPTYRATNPFAEEEQQAKQESARVRTLVNGVQHSPEQASEALTLSRRTGVPADVALRNLDPLRQMASVEEFDADTFVRENPATSRWLQADPINPAIARDDLENLGGFEQLVGRWRMPSASDVLAGLAGGPTAGGRIFQQVQRGRVQAAYEAGQAGIALTELYGTALAAERRTPEFQAKAEALRAQQDIAIPEADDFLERSLVSVARGFAPSMAYVAGEAIEGYVGGFAGAAALGALAGPGALATGAVGGAAGARIKGYNAYRILMTGELAQRLDAAQDAYGNPIPDDVKDAVSLTGGAGLALLGMYGFDKAVGLVAGASRRIAAQAVGNATATALTSATGRRVALEVGKTVLGTTVLETAQEVTEQAGLIAGESVARMIAGGGLDAGDFGPVENVTAELLETAIETAYGAWILGGVGGVSAGVLGLQRINQAKQDGAVIEALAEQAGMSKLRQRDPAKYEELVRLQTPESLERVGIDAEKLTMLLQEQSVPMAQFAEVAGITEQDVAEALARGGDVYIPTPNLLARLVGTPVFDAMKMDLRIRPDGLTQREADEQAKTLEADQKAVEAEMQEIVKNGTTDASGQRVIDDITAQITEATKTAPKGQRFTPENIEATARGIAAFFITTAERTGQDAFALYQSRNYRIVGRETAEPLYNALVEAQKLEKSGKNPKRLAELRGTIAALRGTMSPEDVARMEQAAFHGTPYTFDKFSLSAIGTGEGAQAFGWGLYFAESQDVAEGYQRTLSDQTILVDGEEVVGLRDNQRHALGRIALIGYEAALREATDTLQTFEREFGTEETMLLRDVRERLSAIQSYAGRDVRFRDSGSLYRVDIPDEAVERMLDWDKPLSEQAPEIAEALAKVPNEAIRRRATGVNKTLYTGQEIYSAAETAFGSPREASLALLAAGIPGIKYLDAGSRGAGDGTRNLVVFDENLVTITHRNGEPVTAQERTDFLAQESTGRARAGGERASANGYFYKGGQFLPSTSLPPGKFRIGGKIVKAKKEEVARGVYETQPTPYSRSLYSLAGVGAGVVVNDTGVMEIAAKPVRDNNGNLISRDTEFRPGVAGVTAAESVTLGDIIDAWNSGQRWFSVVPYDVEAGQEVAPTELPSRTDFLAQENTEAESLVGVSLRDTRANGKTYRSMGFDGGHLALVEQIVAEGAEPNEEAVERHYEYGFVTSTGRVVNRAEGLRVARRYYGNVEQLAGADVVVDSETIQELTDFLAQEAMGSAVSTRFPTAMKATEDPLRSLLSIGLAEMQMDPKAFAKNVAAVAQYPNMRVVENETPEQTAERFIQHVSDNLLWLHDQVDEATRQRSKLWYDGARRIAERWSGEYGLTVEQVSGVMAALSPQKDWYQNVSLARRVLDTMSKQAKFRWTPEMTETAARLNAEGKPLLDPEYVALVKGKVLGQLQDAREIAWFVRVYDETYNDRQFPTITPEGGEAGPVLTAKGQNAKVAWGSYNEIAKAVAMALEPSLANISMNLGGAHKVRNFYNNIVDPNSPRGEVTIDTHAVAAGLLRPLSGKSIEVKHNLQGGLGASNSSIFGVVGTYGLFAEAYRRAAVARNVLPREMQSITWEAIRGLFPAEFKDAKNVEAVDAVWQRYRDGTLTLDAVRADVAGLAGGIANPTWYGSDAGLDAGLESPADARGVSEGVGAVGAARPRVRGDVATAVSGQRSGISGGFARARENVRAGLGPNILFQQAGEFAGVALSETIEVDGVSRPTRNSTGQPIHPTEEGVRNFWRWFGDSKVVDAEGRPLVLYHSTNAGVDFDVFDPTFGEGIHVGTAPQANAMFASVAAESKARNDVGHRIIPVYVRAANSLRMQDTGDGWDAVPMSEQLMEMGIVTDEEVGELFDLHEEKGTAQNPELDEAIRELVKSKGYDSFVYLNQFEGDAREDSYLLFDSNQVKSALGNSGEFGPTANILRQGAGRPNAFIMQGVSQKTIALMNGADLSSLLHEFSHDWLEILGDLSQRPNVTEQTQADYAAILKYLGVESRDQIGVPEQEKFARSFERWLATAEAPSRGMARAFVRFKSWMQRIYRMAQEMLVPVDPAIADVFARMLATDEELAQVRGEIGAEPMFTDAESAGKTPQEMADYQRKVELRTAEETGALLSALLREKSEEAKKIRREREKEIRAEVEVEVAERPVYQVVRDLTANAKLDLTDLEAQFGDAIKASLPRGITASEGDMVPVDVIALRYGFRDGTAVVVALQDAKRNTEKQEVNRIVRERMAQEFPDPMERSDVMRMEAQKAAHRSETDDVLLDELRTLSKSAGIRPPNVQAIKNVARQMLGKEQVKHIRPIVYQNAEATAARKAGEAWRSGDGAKAAFHKRQQLLNHILYREAVKATERVAVIERFARKQAQGSAQERLGKAGQQYLEATNAILDSYEFRRVSQAVLDRRAAIAEFVKRSEEENGVVPAIPESVIADAQVVNYRTLSYDAVEAVYETLKQIDHLAGLKNKLLTKQKQKTIEAAEAAIVESIEKHHDIEVRPPDYAPTTFKRLTDAVKKWDAWHVKPEFLFRWLDGEKPFGAVHSLLFQPIADAQNAEARMLKAAVPEIKRLFALIPKNLRKSYDKKLTGADIPAGFTKEQAVALALNWGNASNRLAVAEGFLDEAKTMPHLTPRQIQALLGTLTKAEWDFVQGVWDYIDSFWPEIADLQRRLVGVAPEKIGADPFVQRTADGETITLRGGYYPLAYDREYSWSQRKVDAKQAVQEMADGGFARKVTKHGHTEERVGSGNKPVNLRLSIFPSHIINVIHDLTHREAVIDVRRMSERPAVRAAITGTAGSHLYDSINPWLNRVAAEQNPPASPMEDLLGRARVGATMVNMGFKVTTAVVQPLGYLQSVDLLGVKYARRGMQDFLKSPKQIWSLVKEWSPELESRRTQFDRDVKDAVDKLGVEGWKPEVMQTAFAMTGLADMFVAVPTFYGAYLKSMEVLDPGNHEAAVKYAESVVRQSQSAGGAKDLAMVQGGAESRRMFTMFYSYFSVLYNLFRRSGSMLAQKGVSDLPRFAGSMALLWFLPSVISELIAQRGPEDDEDELPWTLEQIARYPFASVVGVRDVAGGLASYLTEGQMFYDISPVVSAFEAPIRATGGAIEAVGGEPMSRAEVKAAVEAAGYWGKWPSRQIWITGEALYDWMMGYDIAPQDLLFPRPR